MSAWLFWLLLICGTAWAQVGVGSGLVSIDSAKMKVKSAMAVWNPDLGLLTISFFPFALGPDQLEALDRYPADYVVADSPSSKPFFRINMSFKEGSRGPYRASDVKSTTLSAWRIGPSTESLTIQEAPKLLDLEGDFRNQGNLRMSVRGEHRSPFGDKRLFSWNVAGLARVYRHKSAP